MDRLDKLAISILVILVCYAAGLLFMGSNNSQQAKISNNSTQPLIIRNFSPELEEKLKQAQKFLENNNLGKAELLVNELVNAFPYDGQPYMLEGDLFMHQQKPIKAMYAYRNAVDLNPDFLDKKTKLFQGKKIKVSLEEAQKAIESGLQMKPDDTRLKKDLKVLYYMQRKLAGSCG